MPVFQLASSLTLDYRGSALAHAVGNFTGSADLELLFGGPRYGTGFVDEAQPFKLLGVSAGGQLTDLSSTLPAGSTAVHARELVVADFNKDGYADAYSANHGFDSAAAGFPGEQDRLFLGGAGGMTAGALPARSDFAHSADAGDIDGDGDLDILVGNFGDMGTSRSGPYFLKNDGQGGMSVWTGGLSGQALSQLTSTKLVDVDRDGDLDLVGGNHGQPTSAGWVWLNDGAGTFANDPSRALPAGLFDRAITVDIAALDFDGDGDQDLILSQTRQEPFYSGGGLQFLQNDGAGRFTDVTADRFRGQDTSLAWSDKVYAVDLNGDGALDLVISRPGGGATSVALNDGSGRFVAVDGAAMGLSGVYWTPLDYDRDGRTDIVSFSRDIPTDGPLSVSVHHNTGFGIAATAGADVLSGTAARDQVLGGDGGDTILGLAGDDFLRGEGGDDVIVGGPGFDDTHGNAGNDTIYGGAGPDWVVGGQGNDLLYAGEDSWDNVVYGNLGNDTCYGGDGIDWVRGGQGDDVLYGGAGADFVAGDRGNDTLSGGAGADLFHSFAEAGLDRILDFNAAEGDRLNLLAGTTYTLAQSGADVVVSMTGGGQVVLVGVQLSALPEGWIYVG